MSEINTLANSLIFSIKKEEELKEKIAKLKEKYLSEVEAELKEVTSLIGDTRIELGKLLHESGEKNIEVDDYKITGRYQKKVVIKDDEQAISWIKSNSRLTNKEWIKVKESLDKTKFKKFAEIELMKGTKIEGVEEEETYTTMVKKS